MLPLLLTACDLDASLGSLCLSFLIRKKRTVAKSASHNVSESLDYATMINLPDLSGL